MRKTIKLHERNLWNWLVFDYERLEIWVFYLKVSFQDFHLFPQKSKRYGEYRFPVHSWLCFRWGTFRIGDLTSRFDENGINYIGEIRLKKRNPSLGKNGVSKS